MEPTSLERKLTAILSADVKGYSRLMSEDEAATIRTLTAYRELMASLIQQHRGRVVDTPGDNLLAEFVSVVDSVTCAVEVQRELAEQNAELPDHRKMEFRIGINLGDVVVEGRRIYGDGVNIAARLESLAEGGGICISGSVYDSVRSRLKLEYAYLGEQKVKNIAQPVRAYRVLSVPGAAAHRVIQAKRAVARIWGKAALAIAAVVVVIVALAGGLAWWQPWAPEFEPASIERMAFALPDKPSIAVLPFTNMSEDPKQDYFSDGITEDIITDLSKVSGLFVIARNSSFTYKGKPVKVGQVAEELGVRFVLEGSVRRVGDRVRITAQLIDATSGHHVWAERYDRNLTDIFTVQDEVSQKVVSELAVTLKASEQERLFRKHTENVEAYDTFLRARNAPSPRREGILKARKLYERVVELDPMFGGGYAGLSFGYSQSVRMGYSNSPREDVERALALAQKAVSLDETFWWSYLALASAYLMNRQHDEAIAAAERAVEIQPSSADAYNWLSYFLFWAGRGEEAIQPAKIALRLNPQYRSARFPAFLGMAYFSTGRWEEAIKWMKKRLERFGPFLVCHATITASYSELGREEEAKAWGQTLLKHYPKFIVTSWRWARTFKNPKDTERLLNALRKAGLPDDRTSLAQPEKPSIAVLPFANMSDDPKQEYFADGITEDIITDLSKVSGLFVIARTATLRYKGKPVDPRRVSRELGVRYLLEGSVRKATGRLRITAQLIDAKTGNHMWAERYDRDLKDVFAIQDDVAKKVVKELAVTLKADEQERLFRRHTENLEAYETFLRARRVLVPTKERTQRAKKLFERVVELDPRFAGGYAGLSFVYAIRVRHGLSASREEDIERALELAQKAIATDDTFGWSYLALGGAYLIKGEHDKAVAALQEAVRIQPSDADAHLYLGFYLHWSGQGDEAIGAVKTAMRLNPKPRRGRPFAFLGQAYFTAGRYENAIATLNQRYASFARLGTPPLGVLAAAYAARGQDEKASTVMKAFLDKHPGRTLSNYQHPRLYKRKEDRDRIANLLRRAGMPEK